MKDGNEATIGSGITQFAEGEQKVGSVLTKMTQPKTFLDRGYYPPKENLTQSPQSSQSFKIFFS